VPFAERQLAKLLKPTHDVGQVSVFLEQISRKKNDVKAAVARVKISLPGKDVVVERHARDLYEAIAAVSDRALRSVTKMKERRLDLKRLARAQRQEAEYLPAWN
jgi:ribosome-associated translation inhibitor RaiA